MGIENKKNYVPIKTWLFVFIILLTVGAFFIVTEKKPETPDFVIVVSEDDKYTIPDADDSFEIQKEIDDLVTSEAAEPKSMFPKIAVVVNNVGLNQNLTEIMNNSLGENISLSFSPYSRSFSLSIDNAQQVNKDTYIKLIVESDNYLLEDTGPKALNLNKDSKNDIAVLTNMLGTIEHIDGFVMDGYISPKKIDGIENILNFINEKNLTIIDATDNDVISSISIDGLQKIRADIIINDEINNGNIQVFLDTAETIAKERGYSVIVIDNPKLINFFVLLDWIKELSERTGDNKISFVPISTIMVK